MLKMIRGGLILILAAACMPAPTPVPPVERETPAPKFWQGFPIMPGGVEIEDDRAAYHYTVVAEVDAVVKFYREEMKNTEWELLGASPTDGGDWESTVMWFASKESTVSLQVWSKEILTHVAFQVDSRYPTPRP